MDPITASETTAAERVTAYWRAVGLRDESCLTKATRAVMTRVQAGSDQSSPDELPRRAVRLAMQMVEEWMNDLMRASAQGIGEAGGPGLLAVFLRQALEECPEAFLNQACVPDSFRLAVEVAAVPVLPASRPRRMSRQRLGRLFPFLRPAYWRRLIRGLRPLPQGRPSEYPREVAHEPH